MLPYLLLLIMINISINHAIVPTNPNQTNNESSPESVLLSADQESLKNLIGNLKNRITDLEERIAPRSKNKCYIDVKNVSEMQPLMVSLTLTWPTYETNKAGKMIIPGGEEFFLVCPTKMRNRTVNFVTATCMGGTKVMINGEINEFEDIQCTKKMNHGIAKGSDINCLPGDTQKFDVFYDLFSDRTIKVLEVCIDKSWSHGLYAKNVMQRSFGNEGYNTIFSDDDVEDEMLSESCHRNHGCCYSSRLLVDYRDVFPGVPQKAAFDYDYKICNAQNWDDVEHRVRSLAKSSSNDLLVWTGANYDYEKDDNMKYIGSDFYLVPDYIWKVVQDPASRSSLAIIQVNMPLFSVPESTLCPDVCNQTEWMKGSNWADIHRGYTYCCSIGEFEKAFGFYNVFNYNLDSILVGSAPKQN